MTTRALTFNHLGTEVMRISSTGDLGIGARGASAWTSEQIELDHWRVRTEQLAIVGWLNSNHARPDFAERATWTLSGPEYAMFLLRWSGQQ
jgi:hypothetical protein